MSTKPSSQDGHAGDNQDAQKNTQGDPSDVKDTSVQEESKDVDQSSKDTASTEEPKESGHEAKSKWEGLSDDEIERRLSDKIVSKKDNQLKGEQKLRKEIAKTARNTDHVFGIEDPEIANQVVKELWGEDGIYTVSELRDHLKTDDPPVKSDESSNDLSEIKKKISDLENLHHQSKKEREMETKKKVMNDFFERYPQYAPHVDTDGSEWAKLKNKLRIRNLDTLAEDLEDAHYLVNRHYDSSQSMKDAVHVGGGNQVRPSKSVRATDEDVRAAKAVGMDLESYMKHKNAW